MKIKVKLFFAWYDIWIGLFWSREDKKAYICLLPCIVLSIQFFKDVVYCPNYRKGLLCAFYQNVLCGSHECKKVIKKIRKQKSRGRW